MPARTEGVTVSVRPLVPADLAEVFAIERRSFRAPWSPSMFQIELGRTDVIALAAEAEGRLAGYSILSRQVDAWHLMNVAVDPVFRRLRVGSGLVAACLESVGAGVPVTLEVRASNHAAIALYRRLGFRSIGTRTAYYPDDGEDALIMWKGDPGAAGVPAEALGAI
jgi:ribosomal-protein-alanine N-acetyltransferase